MSSEGQIVKRARDILATGAWCKRDMHDVTPEGEVRHCALGALEVAATEALPNDYWAVRYLLDDLVPREYPSIPLWMSPLAAYNDDEETQLQDILNLFNKGLAELGELA